MAVPKIPFDTYLKYDEMTDHLRNLVGSFPDLATMRSVAKSFQGREVWLIEINNPKTGPALEKPGYYIDAQIHAEEHATSAAALYAVWHLLTNYGTDAEVTRLVDTQAFYILPRINPDGAEFALVPPYHNWCGNGRFLPEADRIDGLIPEDIDGDGFIVWMRVPDSAGEWKKSASNPDIMVQRGPAETGGDYFRMYPEGSIREAPSDPTAAEVRIERPFDGNMNRNFPTNWSPQEYGAGLYPLSEPEAKGMADVILEHPNICGMCAYHTHGGIILRPSMTRPDSAMGTRDLTLYEQIGAMGTALTDYPTVSIYEDFTPDKTKPRRGGLMDWTYEEMGIISFGIELWDLERTAGIDKAGYSNRYARSEETLETVHDWVIENVGDTGFRPWKSFDHPQLGSVEIGGMVNIWAYRNPPGALLEDMCRKNVLFNLAHAAAAPQLSIDALEVVNLSGDIWKVRAVVANHGYLPTNLSDVALDNLVAKPVTVTLEGAEIVVNPPLADLGHLAGRTERYDLWSPWGEKWTPTKKATEWVVRAKTGKQIEVTAQSEKAGTIRLAITLE
ncbi:M14 family metallopeptidase [Falsihalocynthiibacter sp. BN13B15]|uniref:M14 family metallopeptidase n=1 Tax=Falsihalocynthiibacter sp. BN13B15 TaxID=3240871 RepID=UPI0035105C60